MAEQEKNFEVATFEALSIKYGDLIITINGDEDGVLNGKTKEQSLAFCADLLFSLTDVSSVENMLDTNIGLQETLKEDYGWKDLDISAFITKWRKRIYLKRIGEENDREEEKENFAVEPSSQDETAVTPEVVSGDSGASVVIPSNNEELTNSFSVIENQSSRKSKK